MRVDSRSWTGLEPTWWEDQGVGMTRVDDWADRWEVRRQDLKHAIKALLMLWGPNIPARPHGSWRRGWTVYDGHIAARGEEWTFWRAIVATLAILSGRRWGQDQVDRFGHRAGESFDMGHWDAAKLYAGWECMCLRLHPRWRVEISSDGDWDL